MSARVLAVDDNPQVIEITVRLLRKLGYEAVGLSDPREVMDAVRTFSPEVCILDIQMPFISGSDLLDSIKASIARSKWCSHRAERYHYRRRPHEARSCGFPAKAR